MLDWQFYRFDQLTTIQLYTLMKLRTDVFVVEQNCPYPELDDKDLVQNTGHLLGYDGTTLVAYARLLPPGLSYPQVSIGRVVVAASARGKGYGFTLVKQALHQCQQLWPDQDIQIGAQLHLEKVYEKFGFKRHCDDYLEDGIPHVDMLLTKGESAAL
ncbi:GNAT family N-acetyltransferase [Alteromonas gilva]|uniref:GNAT family N-acetyltransferase n=1 Tax=Alteromonas gilva TaxID=2987522 RepID=A0ABT5L058_9ALTE|nr:GNAT family N-acetyltransferase [Alteromonas gilva]MDC8829193.1 GNAT family N-acetyltransferase [Alteromonas gilva]